MAWEDFLGTTIGLWVNKHLSTDDNLHGSGKVLEKHGVLHQIEKAAESSDADLKCQFFSPKDVLAHLATSEPSEISNINKPDDCRAAQLRAKELL